MGERFTSIEAKHREFIERQKIFFVATAAAQGRVNLSPKGLDTLRVMGPERILWLNLTGSGNETAAHLALHDRITLMFCAFDGPPNILRAYGTARTIHPRDDEWEALIALFPPDGGARQLIDVRVDLVQTSCGYAVPNYTYDGDRSILTKWAANKGEDGVRSYWKDKNSKSLDGWETGIDA